MLPAWPALHGVVLLCRVLLTVLRCVACAAHVCARVFTAERPQLQPPGAVAPRLEHVCCGAFLAGDHPNRQQSVPNGEPPARPPPGWPPLFTRSLPHHGSPHQHHHHHHRSSRPTSGWRCTWPLALWAPRHLPSSGFCRAPRWVSGPRSWSLPARRRYAGTRALARFVLTHVQRVFCHSDGAVQQCLASERAPAPLVC